MSFVYFFVSVFFIMFCPRTRLGTLWIPLSLVATVSLLGNYIFQFKVFSADSAGFDTNVTNSSKWWPAGASSSWVGLYRLNLDSQFYTGDVGNVSIVHQTHLWLQVKAGLFVLSSKHLAILCVCMLHRRANNTAVAEKIRRRVRKLSIQVGDLISPQQRQQQSHTLQRRLQKANANLQQENEDSSHAEVPLLAISSASSSTTKLRAELSVDSNRVSVDDTGDGGGDQTETSGSGSDEDGPKFSNFPREIGGSGGGGGTHSARTWRYWRSCLRGYGALLDENASNFMHLALVLLICLAACVHTSVISVIYLAILTTNRWWPRFVGKSGTWRLFLALFALSSLFQYAFILGLPPFLAGETSTPCVVELKQLGCVEFGKVGCLACSLQLPADSACTSTSNTTNPQAVSKIDAFCGTTGTFSWFYSTPVGNEYVNVYRFCCLTRVFSKVSMPMGAHATTCISCLLVLQISVLVESC